MMDQNTTLRRFARNGVVTYSVLRADSTLIRSSKTGMMLKTPK
jgi:hypothetical protein